MKRDTTKPTTFKYNWYKSMRDQLRLYYSEEKLTNSEMKTILDSFWDHHEVPTGRIYNTVTHENKETTVEEFINVFLSETLSLSGYGVLFKNHDTPGVVNILAEAIQFLLDERDRYKNQQKLSLSGSTEYFTNKRNQTSVKILVNSIYGCIGMIVSALYDQSVQCSITLCGQDIITTCIYALEAYMADNVPFKDNDVLINYVNNIVNEPYKYDILNYVKPISHKDLIKYLESKCLTETNISMVVNNLNPEMCTRIYYKNHLIELLVNESFAERLKTYIVAKDDSYKQFKEEVIQFTLYDGLMVDRFEFINNHSRKAILLSDTDSAFLYTDPSVDALSKAFNLDRKIEGEQINLINILMDLFSGVMDKIYSMYGDASGLTEAAKKNIYMKNEFVYKRLMVTQNKKTYAGLTTAENGILLKHPEVDIKGLSIKKSTSAKKIRDTFTEILENNILKSEKIDILEIVGKYNALEKDIRESLAKGELIYAIPKSISPIDSYANPERIDGIRGSEIWNALYPEEKIVAPDKAFMIKLIGLSAVEDKIAAKYPAEYAIIKKIMTEGIKNNKTIVDISKFDCDVIAVPVSRDTLPNIFIDMIDYSLMVSTNLSNGLILLETLGIQISTKSTIRRKSNIITI